jgi:1,4-dihydroxy-2-naphthoate octaprenyltransferase
MNTGWPSASALLLLFFTQLQKLPQPIFRNLKKIAVGKTIFLAIVWTYVTTILPAFVNNEPWSGSLVLFTISRFFLIYPICILFDYRDREDDRKDGIRSLITYLDEHGINQLFAGSVTIFAVACLGLYGYHYTPYTIIILLIPGIVLVALYRYAKTHFSDYLYYFVLDGLMMFSGLLMLIADI